MNDTIALTHECATARPAALVGKKVVSWYQAKPIQNPTLRAGPGTIVARVRWSRIPGCSFAVPRRPVNATEQGLLLCWLLMHLYINHLGIMCDMT